MRAKLIILSGSGGAHFHVAGDSEALAALGEAFQKAASEADPGVVSLAIPHLVLVNDSIEWSISREEEQGS